MKKTGQQVISEAREEFEKVIRDGLPEDYYAGKISYVETLKSFLTSILQAFIEAEIKREDGVKINKLSAQFGTTRMEGYNQAKEETISHLRELLELII